MFTKNGLKVPYLIYGTAWKKETTKELTKKAISNGFFGIDTANQPKHYNEILVGEALDALWQEGFRRESLFLQTKFTSIYGQDHRMPYDPSSSVRDQVHQSFQSSLKQLHVDFIDSYLLHGPTVAQGLADEDWEAWSAIENLYEQGKAKLIGVSNVNAEQLELLIEKAKIKPMVVQNRCYAIRGWDSSVRAVCASQDIIYEGFSLLTANVPYLQLPVVSTIAKKMKLSVPQLVFTFAKQQGIVSLTGTNDEAHMKQDLDAMNYELFPEDAETILNIKSFV